eukprot:Nk52_evm50s208 gene=Nk52_evmTU50s208
MVNANGYRRGTRFLFSKQFRKKGPVHLSTYLKTYRVGDIVDIKGDGSIQKGMPHKFYHGKTGVVYNVTPHAVGVVMNKQHRGRIIKKKINVRVEHIKHSTCRDDFLRRVKSNDDKKREARKTGVKVNLKRVVVQPTEAHTVRTAKNKPTTVTVVPYEFLV